MGERLKGLLAPLVLGGLGALLGLLAARAEVAQKAELYLLDQRFVTRWLYPLRPVPVSPDIALVLVDEATYEHLHNPAESDPLRRHWVFWLPLYVRLASGLLEAGATAVGLDVIPQYLDPAYAAEVASALTRQAPRLVVGSYLQLEPGVDTTPVKVPHPVLSELVERAEPRNRALLNLTRDFDGAARAQSLFPLKLADPRGESEEYSWFAARLAELHRGRRFDPAQGTWGGQPLPLLAPDDPRLLINYAAPWQVFPARPMWRVLEAVERGDRQSLRRWFAGKVVLVGLGSLRDQDFAETPFSILRLGSGARLPMPGVEIHAHTLNTLLTGSYLRQVPAWAEGGSVLVLACLVAFLAGRRPVLSGLFWGAAGLGAYLAAGWLLFCRQHLWLHLMPAILAFPLSLTGTYAYRYWFEERARRRLRWLFGRAVSPQVMEEMVRNPRPEELGGTSRRVVTVLFSDINGFSTVSERHPPEQVMAMVNDYFRLMTRVIFRYQGTIKQFVGDEIMALYGAPRTLVDPERKAVATALEMIRLLEEARQLSAGRDGFYSTKVGIHTGEVTLGYVGAAERAEYAAVGDDVNLGSRIMGMTRRLEADILISQATYERVKDMPGVEFLDRGLQEVKGRQEKIRVYEVRRGRGPLWEPSEAPHPRTRRGWRYPG